MTAPGRSEVQAPAHYDRRHPFAGLLHPQAVDEEEVSARGTLEPELRSQSLQRQRLEGPALDLHAELRPRPA